MKYLIYLLFIVNLIQGENLSAEKEKITYSLPNNYSVEIKPIFQILKIPDVFLSDSLVEGYICYDSLRLRSLDENYMKVVLLYEVEDNKMIQLIREFDWNDSTAHRTFIIYVKKNKADTIINSLVMHGFHMKTYQNWFERLFNFDIKYIDFNKKNLKVIYSKKIQSWIYRDCTSKLIDQGYRGFRFTISY